MQTPIDFGKQFIELFFNKRDAEGTLAQLADDLVWVTPDEIRHLKSRQEVLDFIREEIERDPKQYNVDIESIRSAPVMGDTNTIVYNVNLIPKHEENSVNLRCSLSIRKASIGYRLVYVGMSRKYQRTDTEQIRGFIENLPSGILVLASLGTHDLRTLCCNTYFAARLGYDEADFFGKLDENPLFMLPYENQRRMLTVIAELSALKKPKPMSLSMSLVHEDGTEIPFQIISSAAYKDGSSTILYILFNEITDIVKELGRKHEKELKKELSRVQEEGEKRLEEVSAAQQAEYEEAAAKRQAEYEEASAKREAEYEGAIAAQQAEYEEASAKKQAEFEEASAKQQAEYEEAAARQQAEYEEASAERQARMEEAAGEASSMRAALDEAAAKLSRLEERKQAGDKQYEDRILKLEWALQRAEKDTKEKLRAQQEAFDADIEKRKLEAAEEARGEVTLLKQEIEQLRSRMEENRQSFLAQIGDLQEKNNKLADRILQQQAGLRQMDNAEKARQKEKDKALTRMSYLLTGQMRSVENQVQSLLRQKDAQKQNQIVQEILRSAQAAPRMGGDLAVIARLDPYSRTDASEVFSLSECIDTVRKVVWPQCREKGIIFTCSTKGRVPDRVRSSKAGLELAFLTILENAVHYTAQGGRILFTASCDPAVRGRAYYHFMITDTGTGIPEERLPELFGDPESELSIARTLISRMGGSIQVNSHAGQGSVFEIKVNLEVI